MDDGLKDFIQELRDYGNARKGELAGMILEAANRLEELEERVNTRPITLSIDEKYLKKLTDKAVQDAVEEIRQEMLCGDAISRAEVKRIVDFYKSQFDGILHVNESIDKLSPVIPKQSGWIPVSERLPKESDGTVLITVNGQVRTGQYSEFNNTWYKGDMGGVGGDDPIAWMPLPAPYEGAMMREV